MDWTTIILSALSGLITGGGLVSLITLKSTRKKAENDADSPAIANMKTVLDEVQEQLGSMNKMHGNLLEMHEKDTATIEAKNERINTLTGDLATVKMLLCKHDACPFRTPPKGRGGEWYENNKADLPTDSEPVQTFAARQGYTVIYKGDKIERMASKAREE